MGSLASQLDRILSRPDLRVYVSLRFSLARSPATPLTTFDLFPGAPRTSFQFTTSSRSTLPLVSIESPVRPLLRRSESTRSSGLRAILRSAPRSRATFFPRIQTLYVALFLPALRDVHRCRATLLIFSPLPFDTVPFRRPWPPRHCHHGHILLPSPSPPLPSLA
jgi:hypothetical protein